MESFRQRYLQRLKEAATRAISQSGGSSTSIDHQQQQRTVAESLSRLSLSANNDALPSRNAASLQQKSAPRKEVRAMSNTSSLLETKSSKVASKKRKSRSTPSKTSFAAAAVSTTKSKAKRAKMSPDCSKGGDNTIPSPRIQESAREITDAQYENVIALMKLFCKVPFLAEFSRPDMSTHPENMTLYSKIIPTRIDLGYVCRAIHRREYDTIRDIQSDVEAVFTNFINFFTHPSNDENPLGHLSSIVIASKAKHLLDYFDSLWQEYMLQSDEPPYSISYAHPTFQKRAERRIESLSIIESTVLTPKFVRKLTAAFESFISSGGKVDILDKDAILDDTASASDDIKAFVQSLRSVIKKIELEVRTGQGYTVLDLHRDVKQCYLGDVFMHKSSKKWKRMHRLDRIIGKLLAPVREMSCRGVNSSRVWGCMTAIVWARKSEVKPYWPAIVLGILAPDDLKEDWHRSLTDRNEARLPKHLREYLTVAKMQAKEDMKMNKQMGYFLVELMGSHEFIWVREENIIEPFDPDEKVNVIKMSNAIEEGRSTLKEFEALINDACADGFETDDENNDSIFSFETLCQSDDVASDMHGESEKALGSKVVKLNTLRDVDGRLGSRNLCGKGKVNQGKDRAKEKAIKSHAKATQECETDPSPRVLVAETFKKAQGNYSGSWTPSKALAAMNSSSDSDSDNDQTLTDHSQHHNAAKVSHSPPILQDEVQDEAPVSLELKSQQGLCGSPNGSVLTRSLKKKSVSSLATAGVINAPAISVACTQRTKTITTPPKRVLGPLASQNDSISACNISIDFNTEDTKEVEYIGLYSPIMNPSPPKNGGVAASNSILSSPTSSASAPCNSFTLHPTTVAGRTATTLAHYDAVVAIGRHYSLLNQDSVIDLTIDSSDEEDIDSRSPRDKMNDHTTQPQQEDGTLRTALQNDVSNGISTYQETVPVDRSAAFSNTTSIVNIRRKKFSLQAPLRMTNVQSVISSHRMQRDDALRGPCSSVRENCSISNYDNVGTLDERNVSDSTPSDASATDQTSTRQAELTAATTLVHNSASISCSLTGTLAATTRANGSTCHVIRGTWVNEDFPTSTPLKFVLRRNVPPENRSMPLTTDGDFHGTFTCRVKNEKGRTTDVCIKEKNVIIQFIECESGMYTLRGAGKNRFGKFDLAGRAHKLNGSENYQLKFQKLYTELAQGMRPNTDNSAPSSKKKEIPVSSADDLVGVHTIRCQGESSREACESIIAGIRGETLQKSNETTNAGTDTCRTSTTSTHIAGVSSVTDVNGRKSIELRSDSSDDDNIGSSGPQDRRISSNADSKHHAEDLPETILNGSNSKLNRNKLCFDISRADHKARGGHELSSRFSRIFCSNHSFKNDVLGELKGEYLAISSFPGNRPSFNTPLSHHFLKFIISWKITSDELLANADFTILQRAYMDHMRSLKRTSSDRLCQEACRSQGLKSSADDIQWKTRVDADPNAAVMNKFPILCRDELVNGLPLRTICTIGPSYDILYEFVISIRQSNCSAAAGIGAFLTFMGAKVLKASSKWKQGAYQTGKVAKTRGSREAVVSNSRYIVTLTGRDIHDDKLVEFTPEDFIDTQDNITFSSKHFECGLVELEDRYGPLLPSDRKTELVFLVKDFLFSHEPSVWRFDVDKTMTNETLTPNARHNPNRRSLHKDQPTVIDITDDVTGAPHDIAESHTSMYVNEVGHNPDLVENIESRNNEADAVTYYINIDKPLAKGDTVELLVNYKETYEHMRVRRGYGRENLFNGINGDYDDIARVQRNVQERIEIEEVIKTYTLHDFVQVVYFLKDKVWDGLKAATSELATDRSHLNLLRQCIARRRIAWMTRLLSNHLDSLLKKEVPVIGQFQKGTYVCVHDWPPECVRPPYTGLAMIDSISKDEHDRETLTVITSDNKCIWDVPEAVVTFPTADDMESVSKRDWAKWKTWKAEQEIPRILDCLAAFKWDTSFARSINAVLPTSQVCEKILVSLRWDIVEEMLFVLEKNNRVSPNFAVSRRCPLSATFVSNCLLLIADFLLLDKDNDELFRCLMDLVRVTGFKLQDTIERIDMSADLDLSLVGKLTFELGQDDRGVAQRRLVIEPNNEMSVDQFLNHPTHLDYVWYAIYQIALPLHQIMSLVDWGTLYSVETVCEELSISLSEDELSKFKNWDPLM